MQELKDFHLTGNVIHTTWFKTITKENGKADLVAINILGEIVYWYKPTEIRAEITGEHLGWRNKYKDDLLQKSYSSLAEQFGLGERQVKDAIIRLEKLGVIKRVFRNIVNNGMILNNVLYIELSLDGLRKISTLPLKDEDSVEKGHLSHEKGTPPTPKCDTPPVEKGQPPHGKGIAPTPECHTNTEITTEITTETNNIQSEIVLGADAPIYSTQSQVQNVIDDWNNNKYLPKLQKWVSGTDRDRMLKCRIKQYGLDKVLQAVQNISQSDFLQGLSVGSNNKPFNITFDWFIRPNNFPKVLEGNYINKNNKSSTNTQKEPDIPF